MNFQYVFAATYHVCYHISFYIEKYWLWSIVREAHVSPDSLFRAISHVERVLERPFQLSTLGFSVTLVHCLGSRDLPPG